MSVLIYVNNGPDQEIHVGACGGVGWPVTLVANDAIPDLGVIANARLWVARPVGADPEEVTWPLVITSDDATRRPAYYRFKGVDVNQDPPDLCTHGNYIGFVQVDMGDGKWIRFGRTMCLKVSPNP